MVDGDDFTFSLEPGAKPCLSCVHGLVWAWDPSPTLGFDAPGKRKGPVTQRPAVFLCWISGGSLDEARGTSASSGMSPTKPLQAGLKCAWPLLIGLCIRLDRLTNASVKKVLSCSHHHLSHSHENYGGGGGKDQ